MKIIATLWAAIVITAAAAVGTADSSSLQDRSIPPSWAQRAALYLCDLTRGDPFAKPCQEPEPSACFLATSIKIRCGERVPPPGPVRYGFWTSYTQPSSCRLTEWVENSDGTYDKDSGDPDVYVLGCNPANSRRVPLSALRQLRSTYRGRARCNYDGYAVNCRFWRLRDLDSNTVPEVRVTRPRKCSLSVSVDQVTDTRGFVHRVNLVNYSRIRPMRFRRLC